MTTEEMLYGFALLVVALGVVIINDRQKAALAKKAGSHDDEPNEVGKSHRTSWSYVATLLVGSLIVIAICAYGNPKWLLLIPIILCVIVAGVILKVFAPLIWVYMKVPFGGSKPRLVISDSSGVGETDCPKCGKKVKVTAPESGGHAFECANCGEKATWT
jgi:hypothetical protein